MSAIQISLSMLLKLSESVPSFVEVRPGGMGLIIPAQTDLSLVDEYVYYPWYISCHLVSSQHLKASTRPYFHSLFHLSLHHFKALSFLVQRMLLFCPSHIFKIYV